jgi:glycosyltransferase involved in cell wall biosynthesis
MFKGQKVIVVMPAYNAEKTLRKTYNEVMDQQIVDDVIVVDDASRDAGRGFAVEQRTRKRSNSCRDTRRITLPDIRPE